MQTPSEISPKPVEFRYDLAEPLEVRMDGGGRMLPFEQYTPLLKREDLQHGKCAIIKLADQSLRFGRIDLNLSEGDEAKIIGHGGSLCMILRFEESKGWRCRWLCGFACGYVTAEQMKEVTLSGASA